MIYLFKINIKQIGITFLTYLALTIGWTYLSIIFDDFTKNDKGLVTGLGYLMIFSFAIFVGKQPLKISKLFILTIGIITIFVSMSFLSFLLMLLFTNLKFEIPILVIVSIITSFLLIQLLNKLYIIQNKVYLIFFTFLFVLLA